MSRREDTPAPARANRHDLLFKLLIMLLIVGVAWVCIRIQMGGSLSGSHRPIGTVRHEDLTEVSGIVASRQNPGVLWAHNDSGDSARLFAMKTDGSHLGIYALTGARAVDYEDIAIGPGPKPDVDYLYVADTGNNMLDRSVVTVYRVPEPVFEASPPSDLRALQGVEALRMKFPDGPHECETLLSDPLTGDLYLISRDRDAGRRGQAFVFRCAAPHHVGVIHTLELVARFSAPVQIKGGDLSPDGRIILLRAHSPNGRTPARAWIWDREESLATVLRTRGHAVPAAFEEQGEAIAFAPDGRTYFTVGEGLHAPIYRYDFPPLEGGER